MSPVSRDRPVRRRCDSCGNPDRFAAFVDETQRDPVYGLAAVIGCACELDDARKAIRRLVRRGQRRIHFTSEQDRGRKAFLSAIARTRVRALYASTVGRPSTARSECWTRLVPTLASLGVSSLCIERQDGAEDRDRRDIRGSLESNELLGSLRYWHEAPASEPLLWVADAVAWSASYGGEWRSRIASILLDTLQTTRDPTPHRPERSRAHFRS